MAGIAPIGGMTVAAHAGVDVPAAGYCRYCVYCVSVYCVYCVYCVAADIALEVSAGVTPLRRSRLLRLLQAWPPLRPLRVFCCAQKIAGDCNSRYCGYCSHCGYCGYSVARVAKIAGADVPAGYLPSTAAIAAIAVIAVVAAVAAITAIGTIATITSVAAIAVLTAIAAIAAITAIAVTAASAAVVPVRRPAAGRHKHSALPRLVGAVFART